MILTLPQIRDLDRYVEYLDADSGLVFVKMRGRPLGGENYECSPVLREQGEGESPQQFSLSAAINGQPQATPDVEEICDGRNPDQERNLEVDPDGDDG